MAAGAGVAAPARQSMEGLVVRFVSVFVAMPASGRLGVVLLGRVLAGLWWVASSTRWGPIMGLA